MIRNLAWRRRCLTLVGYLLLPLTLVAVVVGLFERLLGEKDPPVGRLLALPFRRTMRALREAEKEEKSRRTPGGSKLGEKELREILKERGCPP